MSTTAPSLLEQCPSFVSGLAYQGRLKPDDAIGLALSKGYSHLYVEAEKLSHDEITIQSLSDRIKAAGIQPIIHGNYLNALASPDVLLRDAARLNIILEIKQAANFSSPLILHAVSNPRLHDEKPDSELARNIFSAELSKLEKFAEKQGVPIWLENLPLGEATVLASQNDYAFFSKQHPKIKYVFDVGHANILNDHPMDIFRQFHRNISAISLSDNNGLYDGHLALGKGSVDFTSVLSTIKSQDWRGVLVFETLGVGVEDGIRYLNNIDRSLVKMPRTDPSPS